MRIHTPTPTPKRNTHTHHTIPPAIAVSRLSLRRTSRPCTAPAQRRTPGRLPYSVVCGWPASPVFAGGPEGVGVGFI